MNALHEKYADQGLVVVGVSDETEQKLTGYIEDKGVEYGVVRAQGALRQYGGRGYPTFVTIGPHGDVVHRGRIPSDELIEKQLVHVDLVPDMPDDRAFTRIEQAWRNRDFERVDRELTRRARRAEEGSERHNALVELRREFDELLARTNRAVERLAAGPDYYRSTKQLEKIADEFDGLPPAEAAEQVLDRFEDDDAIQDEIDASRHLERLVGRYDTSSIAQAGKLREQLAKFCRAYSGTRAAERASKLRTELARRR